MAIITDIVSEVNYTYRSQYCRPDSVIAKNKTTLTVAVGVYETAQRAESGEPPHLLYMLDGTFDMYSDQNLWQQAYAAMKQKWPDSTDA
jgi:hypothetical protein